MIKDDHFKNIRQVAVVGGNLDTSGLTSQSVKVCKVIQVGESDIMVEDTTAYTPTVQVVPKSICIPIVVNPEQLHNNSTASLGLGDLIYTVQRADWKEKTPSKTVGILYEIKYELGQAKTLTLLVGDEFQTVKNENILVLQKRQKPQKKS